MKTYRQLVTEYPELGDILADFESRILFLENSLARPSNLSLPIENKTPPEQPKFDNHQWDTVQQLKGQIIHLQNKLNEHIDFRRKKTAKVPEITDFTEITEN